MWEKARLGPSSAYYSLDGQCLISNIDRTLRFDMPTRSIALTFMFFIGLPIVEVERLVVRDGQRVDADVRRRVPRHNGKVRRHPEMQSTKNEIIENRWLAIR